MFVRWKTKKKSPGRYGKPAPTLLYAQLVESIRIDGKPRQKVIKHLGSIEQEQLNTNINKHCYFWDHVEEKLQDLLAEGISSIEIQKIRESLQKKVFIPTREQIDQAARDFEKKISDLYDLT